MYLVLASNVKKINFFLRDSLFRLYYNNYLKIKWHIISIIWKNLNLFNLFVMILLF
jgi:hypothetical protein